MIHNYPKQIHLQSKFNECLADRDSHSRKSIDDLIISNSFDLMASKQSSEQREEELNIGSLQHLLSSNSSTSTRDALKNYNAVK
jgi:hypothetical protein